MKIMWMLLAWIGTTLGVAVAESPLWLEEPRAAGMGGAFVARPDVSRAPFYNPAALAWEGPPSWQLFQLSGHTSSAAFEVIDMYDRIDATLLVRDKVQVVRDKTPLFIEASAHNWAYYADPPHCFGHLFRAAGGGHLLRPESPEATGNFFYDSAFVYARGHRHPQTVYWDSHPVTLYYGATLKWLTRRKEVDNISGQDEILFTALDIIHETYNDRVHLEQGQGLGMDIAALAVLEDERQTTLGLQVRDLFGTRLRWGEGHRSTIRPNVRVGLAQAFPEWARQVRAHSAEFLLDLEDLLNTQGTSLGSRLHGGAEIQKASGSSTLAFRLGLQEGGFSVGLGWHWRGVQMDYANFPRRTGTVQKTAIERTHNLSLAVNF